MVETLAPAVIVAEQLREAFVKRKTKSDKSEDNAAAAKELANQTIKVEGGSVIIKPNNGFKFIDMTAKVIIADLKALVSAKDEKAQDAKVTLSEEGVVTIANPSVLTLNTENATKLARSIILELVSQDGEAAKPVIQREYAKQLAENLNERFTELNKNAGVKIPTKFDKDKSTLQVTLGNTNANIFVSALKGLGFDAAATTNNGEVKSTVTISMPKNLEDGELSEELDRPLKNVFNQADIELLIQTKPVAPAPVAPVTTAPTAPVTTAPTTPVAPAPAPTTPVAPAPAPAPTTPVVPAPTTPVAPAPVVPAPTTPVVPAPTTPAGLVAKQLQEAFVAKITTDDTSDNKSLATVNAWMIAEATIKVEGGSVIIKPNNGFKVINGVDNAKNLTDLLKANVSEKNSTKQDAKISLSKDGVVTIANPGVLILNERNTAELAKSISLEFKIQSDQAEKAAKQEEYAKQLAKNLNKKFTEVNEKAEAKIPTIFVKDKSIIQVTLAGENALPFVDAMKGLGFDAAATTKNGEVKSTVTISMPKNLQNAELPIETEQVLNAAIAKNAASQQYIKNNAEALNKAFDGFSSQQFSDTNTEQYKVTLSRLNNEEIKRISDMLEGNPKNRDGSGANKHNFKIIKNDNASHTLTIEDMTKVPMEKLKELMDDIKNIDQHRTKVIEIFAKEVGLSVSDIVQENSGKYFINHQFYSEGIVDKITGKGEIQGINSVIPDAVTYDKVIKRIEIHPEKLMGKNYKKLDANDTIILGSVATNIAEDKSIKEQREDQRLAEVKKQEQKEAAEKLGAIVQNGSIVINSLLYQGKQALDSLLHRSGSDAPSTPAKVVTTADKPAAEKPAAEKPAAEKPAAEKPAAEKPADKESPAPNDTKPEEPPSFLENLFSGKGSGMTFGVIGAVVGLFLGGGASVGGFMIAAVLAIVAAFVGPQIAENFFPSSADKLDMKDGKNDGRAKLKDIDLDGDGISTEAERAKAAGKDKDLLKAALLKRKDSVIDAAGNIKLGEIKDYNEAFEFRQAPPTPITSAATPSGAATGK